ncbi:nucleotide sugar dehydrogenase [Albibacterium bauzanense]|uniref:UDP-glucose 6-dehydrogenase n=1 Tax=Albibacterium bauzanense TaxID=653929 RepID=A0A4R1M0X6_9SPHI|nr:nucleotide sugar dehydrogenase [Albibacterium bauzanense]TCK84947.1 GDP-mannose 6-dehydrogenase [Albibacterium bauzanense]
MNISIFGLGYVGCVSIGCLAKNGNHVVGVDPNIIKVNQINSGRATIIEKDIDHIIKEQKEAGRISATIDYKKAILETDISIIAVGTPSTLNGHLNLGYMFNVAENFGETLMEKEGFHVIAIRSTVMPGTADRFATIIEEKSGKLRNVDFAIVSNPEFLREGSAVADYNNPPLTLIGSHNPQATKIISSLYAHLPAEIVITDIRVAEIMKYVNNTFHALKISFANEIGNICSALDIDSHKVMDIFCKDKHLNISPYYFKPGFAYGGSCLPKDLKGLQTLAHDLYIKAPVIENIDKTNEVQIQRAVEIIVNKNKKKLGFLGLSFKAGTDDLRNSPSVSLIEILLGKGYQISIYDKNVEISKLTGTNKEYIEARIPHLSKLMESSINSLLDDSDMIIVNNKEEEYSEVLSSWNSDKTILDMVRLDQEVRKLPGYKGINW